jgi:hypothetical protein
MDEQREDRTNNIMVIRFGLFVAFGTSSFMYDIFLVCVCLYAVSVVDSELMFVCTFRLINKNSITSD